VGAGRAKRITYTDPATRKTITLKNVKLPWHADKPLVALGAPFILLNLNAIAGRLMSPIGCDISVNGKTAVEQAPQATGFANCVKSYTPPE
jgi:hypothetical protein